MKKIFIILLLFICGCETIQITTRNPKCEDIKSFKVFQVADTFVLAFVCELSPLVDRCFHGHVVYFQKEKDKIYFDDQIIKVKSNECAIYIGTHQYLTQNSYKTVPIVKIINSQITNPE